MLELLCLALESVHKTYQVPDAKSFRWFVLIPIKSEQKRWKDILLCSDWHSQGLWQADSAELSWKKYIEMVGQQHLLYKYNPTSRQLMIKLGGFFIWAASGMMALLFMAWGEILGWSELAKLHSDELLTETCSMNIRTVLGGHHSPSNTISSGGKQESFVSVKNMLFFLRSGGKEIQDLLKWNCWGDLGKEKVITPWEDK